MMKLFHNLSVIILKIIDIFLRLFNCEFYYENKYGIKDFNSPSFVLNEDSLIKIIKLNPANVFLGFDGLKNQYTLIDKPISDSPHMELIRLINSGKDISKCDYIIREINGFLDHRNKQFLGERLINYHQEMNKRSDRDRLPLVYKIDDRYYVLDGKHRFASSYLSGDNAVKCILISCKEVAEWKYLLKLYNVLKRKKGYSKQLNHIDSIMKLGDIRK